MLLDPLAQPQAAFEPVPECFRRHPENEIVRLAGHHLVDRRKHCAPDVGQKLTEIVVVADWIVWNVNAAEVIGDAAGAHIFIFGLHCSVS